MRDQRRIGTRWGFCIALGMAVGGCGNTTHAQGSDGGSGGGGSGGGGGNGTATIRPSLKRVAVTGPGSGAQKIGAPRSGGRHTQALQQASDEVVTNEVTITSLKVPIASIGVSNQDDPNTTASGSKSFPAYQCPGSTTEECMVELVGGALDNLLGDIPALATQDGNFTQVNVSPCVNGSNSDVYYKLTATVPALTTYASSTPQVYYTNATTGLSTTGPAEEITLHVQSGCNASYFLPDALQILDGKIVGAADADAAAATIALDLFFDIANVATAAGGTANSMAGIPTGNCLAQDAQHPYICLNFPTLVATLGAAPVQAYRFLLVDSASTPIFSPTVLGIYLQDGETVPFGGYLRPFYDGATRPLAETLQGSTFRKFTANADGSLQISTYYNWMSIASFPLHAHQGEMVLDKHDDPSANPSSLLNGTRAYTATTL